MIILTKLLVSFDFTASRKSHNLFDSIGIHIIYYEERFLCISLTFYVAQYPICGVVTSRLFHEKIEQNIKLH